MRSPTASGTEVERRKRRQRFQLSRRNRILDEDRPERRQLAHQHARHRRMDPAVEIESEVERVANCRAQLAEPVDDRVDWRRNRRHGEFFADVHLHRA